MRENNKELFGEDVISMTDEVYGLDEEGEIKGSYRPSGYPGVSTFSLLLECSSLITAALDSYGLLVATSTSPASCQRF